MLWYISYVVKNGDENSLISFCWRDSSRPNQISSAIWLSEQ